MDRGHPSLGHREERREDRLWRPHEDPPPPPPRQTRSRRESWRRIRGAAREREKRSKEKRHLCSKPGWPGRSRGRDPVDEGFRRLNKHVITDCLQLAALYLPTKVTIHPPLPLLPPAGSIIFPGWLGSQTAVRGEGEGKVTRRARRRSAGSEPWPAGRASYVARRRPELTFLAGEKSPGRGLVSIESREVEGRRKGGFRVAKF